MSVNRVAQDTEIHVESSSVRRWRSFVSIAFFLREEKMPSYSVLIADDSRLCRNQLSALPVFIDKNVFKIVGEAQNGLEALDILRREKVDIVLTDIHMPKMNGISLLCEIKRENLCPCVIFVSGSADFDYAVAGIQNGVFDYVTKPVDEHKIAQSIFRAKYFIDSKRKQDFFWISKADAVIKAIINCDWLIDGAVYNFLEYIKNQDFSITELEIELNHILEYISSSCLEARPYIRKFSLIEKICQIKNMLFNSPDELIDYARLKIKELYSEFNKFNLNTENPVLKNIGNHIIENVEQSVSLEDISNDFLMNKKYLSTLFKKEAGISFIDYVSHVKIERAKILLCRSGYKVNQVAAKLGYKDVAYFSRLFKEKTGKTPLFYSKAL